MRCLLLLLTVGHFNATTLVANESPTDPAPLLRGRDPTEPGYARVPNFSGLDLVKEGAGTPDPTLTAVIADAQLRRRVEAGEFTSLRILDLGIKRSGVYLDRDTLSIPYVVSLQRREGGRRSIKFDQGPLYVMGRLQVEYDGAKLRVTLVKFDDSYWLGYLGRNLDADHVADLAFARGIVPPQLENWFNADPGRIEALLKLADGPKAPDTNPWRPSPR